MTNLKFGKCTRTLIHSCARIQSSYCRHPLLTHAALHLISMGCGGSRADAIEPRFHESWTRETESTWLTATDAETPNDLTYKNRVVRGECSHLIKDNAKLSGRGMEARSCGDRGRRMVNAGTQCGKQVSTSSTCTNHQKTSCGHEITDSKQTAQKEGTARSEGVSSNAASHPREPWGKKSSSPHVGDTL